MRASSRVSRPSTRSRSIHPVTPRRSPPTSPAHAASTSSRRRFPVATSSSRGSRRPRFRAGPYQWQYALTGADRVPDRVARAAAGVRVAIVDSGADLSAPDLEAKRPLTYNAVNNSRDVADPVGHGTFVASLAAGSASNGEGMAGVAGEAQLTTIKASMEGRFTDFEVAAAIAYAVDTGAKVVNLSVGGTKSSQTERRAIEYAFAKDVLLVAAAGNEALKGNPVEYPAAHLQRVGRTARAGTGSPSARRRAPAREPPSRTTAPTSHSPPPAKRSSARSPRIRRRWTTRA